MGRERRILSASIVGLLWVGCNLPPPTENPGEGPSGGGGAPRTTLPQGTCPDWLVGLWTYQEKKDLTTRTTDTTLRADGSFEYHHLWSTAGVSGGRAAGNEIWRAGRWTYASGTLVMNFDPSRDRSEWPLYDDSPFVEPQWSLPITKGTDEEGRTALFSNGEIIAVKAR